LEYRGNTGGQIPPENEYCALLDRLNISHLKDMTIEDMSDGEAAFLDLAGMLLRDAPVLLIDSVFDKLGRDESETLADLIGEVTDDGKTVVTAINWPENHKCFDRTLELFDGRLEDIT
jgi:ABC-type Mn2+/Zn2+ transport system ATPase subunit